MKAPAFQFYPGDWLRDTNVLSATARGVWISLLVAMWDRSPRGKLKGTTAEICRITGASEAEVSSAFEEFSMHNICDLERSGNGVVTLTSRRMVRDEKERGNTRSRVQKHRSKTAGVTDVKHESNSPLHSSSSSSGTTYLCGEGVSEAFKILTDTVELRSLSAEQWAKIRQSYAGHPKFPAMDWVGWAKKTADAAVVFGNIELPGPWVSKRLGEALDGGFATEKKSGAAPVMLGPPAGEM